MIIFDSNPLFAAFVDLDPVVEWARANTSTDEVVQYLEATLLDMFRRGKNGEAPFAAWVEEARSNVTAVVEGGGDVTVSHKKALSAGVEQPRKPLSVVRRDGLLQTYLQFFDTHIIAGSSVTMSAQPQVPFKPKRLVVVADDPKLIRITDIRIGPNSQCINWGSGAPGSCFPPLPFNLSLEEKATFEKLQELLVFNTAQISQMVSVHVTNIGENPQRVSLLFWGETLK